MLRRNWLDSWTYVFSSDTSHPTEFFLMSYVSLKLTYGIWSLDDWSDLRKIVNAIKILATMDEPWLQD